MTSASTLHVGKIPRYFSGYPHARRQLRRCIGLKFLDTSRGIHIHHVSFGVACGVLISLSSREAGSSAGRLGLTPGWFCIASAKTIKTIEFWGSVLTMDRVKVCSDSLARPQGRCARTIPEVNPQEMSPLFLRYDGRNVSGDGFFLL